jgi:hypothetical protein
VRMRMLQLPVSMILWLCSFSSAQYCDNHTDYAIMHLLLCNSAGSYNSTASVCKKKRVKKQKHIPKKYQETVIVIFNSFPRDSLWVKVLLIKVIKLIKS